MPGDYYDPGELTVEMLFDADAEPAYLVTDVAEPITITFPGSSTWVADGFLTGFEWTAPLEDVMTATVTLKLTGDITVS
jgi:hypothetical protein